MDSDSDSDYFDTNGRNRKISFVLDSLVGLNECNELLLTFYDKIRKYIYRAPEHIKGTLSALTIYPLIILSYHRPYGNPVISINIHEVESSKKGDINEFIINYIFHYGFLSFEKISEFYALKDRWEKLILNNIREIFGDAAVFDNKWNITIQKCKLNLLKAELKAELKDNYSIYITIIFNLIYVGDVMPGGKKYIKAQNKYDTYEAGKREEEKKDKGKYREKEARKD